MSSLVHAARGPFLSGDMHCLDAAAAGSGVVEADDTTSSLSLRHALAAMSKSLATTTADMDRARSSLLEHAAAVAVFSTPSALLDAEDTDSGPDRNGFLVGQLQAAVAGTRQHETAVVGALQRIQRALETMA